MKRIATFLAAASACSGVMAAYVTGFENPPFNGSAAGVVLSGQDGWYLPAVTGSVDWNVHTYAGNALGLSTLPVVGQSQFIGGMSDTTGSGFARAQRDENFASANVWTASYYMATKFNGTAPASQNLGSFSQQPSATNRYWQSLYTWVDLNMPDHWNAWFLAYDAGGVQFAQPGKSPGAAWDNLEVDHWYRQSTTWDYQSNRILRTSITDMNTGVTAVALPPFGTMMEEWYLTGGQTGGGGFPIATAYRFFVGGIQNVMGIDNVNIQPGMRFIPETITEGPGIRLSGDTRHVFESEDQRLVYRPGIVFSTQQAPVQVTMKGTSAVTNPSTLTFTFESSANQANIGQVIELLNVNTNSLEVMDTHTLTTSDTTTTINVTSNASRFVDQTTRMVTAKISCKAVGPVFSYPWQVRFDLAVFGGNP